jgi:hypothetical protein
VQEAGRYFATNWYSSNNDNARFQRISAASEHAERDTKLPDGEDHRLRIIEPLDPADRDALLADPASPAYVCDVAARKYVVRIAGAVLLKLVQCSELLPRNHVPTKDKLLSTWQIMWSRMLSDCNGWLASLPAEERPVAISQIMALLCGKVQWGSAKILYDTGIVFRSSSSPYVEPISIAAQAALLRASSAYNLATRVRTSSIADGRLRGFELERQVLARLDGFLSTHGLPCKLLDGTPAPAVEMPCSYSLPFSSLVEVVAHDVPVLFCPVDQTYPCDAILMPAAGCGGVVYIIECSSTDPTVTRCAEKVGKYFGPSGIAQQLKARGFPVVVLIFHDCDLPVRQTLSEDVIAISKGNAIPTPAASASSQAADVPSPAPAATAIKGKRSSKKLAAALQPQQAPTVTVLALGDVVRVVDKQSLERPLGVLV